MTITMTVSSDVTDVWQHDNDVTLNLTLDSKIENKWKEDKNEKENWKKLMSKLQNSDILL